VTVTLTAALLATGKILPTEKRKLGARRLSSRSDGGGSACEQRITAVHATPVEPVVLRGTLGAFNVL
jgi:hypothetical protein